MLTLMQAMVIMPHAHTLILESLYISPGYEGVHGDASEVSSLETNTDISSAR
jgi:hypothetical protein